MVNENFALVSNANNHFANKLYEIISKEDGNVFFSPLSAHTILALAYQGSASDTAKSFEDVLQVPNHKATADGYNNLMNSLNKIEDVTLRIANKIFVKQGFTLKNEFKATATESFLSEAEEVDFEDREMVANNINGWVEAKTNSKIKNIVTPGDFKQSTLLILLNAIYFKGNWLHQFDEKATYPEPFHITSNEQVECQMMHIKKSFSYCNAEHLNSKILELTYTNENVSMVIILPNEIDGIAELETKLASVDLSTITKDMCKLELQVTLPKFKIETTIDLVPVLRKMGLGIIFDNGKADFAALSESGGLYVSQVIQKAFIEVNEEGAEAAAVTKMKIMKRCSPKPPPRFVVDHPFIVLLQIKDKEDEEECRISTLFYGKIVNPNPN